MSTVIFISENYPILIVFKRRRMELVDVLSKVNYPMCLKAEEWNLSVFSQKVKKILKSRSKTCYNKEKF